MASVSSPPSSPREPPVCNSRRGLATKQGLGGLQPSSSGQSGSLCFLWLVLSSHDFLGSAWGRVIYSLPTQELSLFILRCHRFAFLSVSHIPGRPCEHIQECCTCDICLRGAPASRVILIVGDIIFLSEALEVSSAYWETCVTVTLVLLPHEHHEFLTGQGTHPPQTLSPFGMASRPILAPGFSWYETPGAGWSLPRQLQCT